MYRNGGAKNFQKELIRADHFTEGVAGPFQIGVKFVFFDAKTEQLLESQLSA